MTAIKLTATQQRFFDLMADGRRHSMQEFINLLPDELSGKQGVYNHINNLRRALEGTTEDIVCEFIQRRTTYRRVRKMQKQGE